MEKGSAPSSSVMLTCACMAIAVLISCAGTYLLTINTIQQQCQSMPAFYGLPAAANDKADHVERMHDPATGTTAIRSFGTDKCFIVSGDSEAAASASRVLSVVGMAMTSEQIAAVYGPTVARFCEQRMGFAVTIADPKDEHRSRRQAQTPAPAADLGGQIEGTGPQRGVDGRLVNECQNAQIVDCGSDQALFKCNTGPGEVYRAQLKCNDPNHFTFALTRRCNKFKNSNNLRFIKCLQFFIYGKQGEQFTPDD